jgi:hypothetical protein
MKAAARRLPCIVVVAAFTCACTGAERAFHLHACDEDHDGDECTVCYQLTKGTSAVVDAAPSLPGCFEVVSLGASIPDTVLVVPGQHEPFSPRGPPTS